MQRPSVHHSIMKKSFFKIAAPAILLVLLDQITKIAAAVLVKNSPLEILPGLKLEYHQNVGIAWSIQIPQPWLNILNIGLLIILPLYISQHIDLRRKESRLFLSMIVGGALGNLWDRLTKGYVIDFISVGSFPVFNLADSLLTVGIFLILIFYGKIKRA